MDKMKECDFRPMTDPEYVRFIEVGVNLHAAERGVTDGLTAEESPEFAKKTFSTLLLERQNTKNHWIYAIYPNGKSPNH